MLVIKSITSMTNFEGYTGKTSSTKLKKVGWKPENRTETLSKESVTSSFARINLSSYKALGAVSSKPKIFNKNIENNEKKRKSHDLRLKRWTWL